MADLAIVILAAGKGSRMLSKTQKILHNVGGKPMVQHVFDAARQVATLPPLLVVAPDEDGVQALFGAAADYAVQPQALGTGHATRMAAPLLQGRCDRVIVTYGDMPLLRAETLQQLADEQAASGAAVVMTTVSGDRSSSFGRVVRDGAGRVVEICEVAEARRRPESAALLAITELNVGVYCFSADFLWQSLPHLPVRQARSGQEYYLTDLIAGAVARHLPVSAIPIADPDECLGAGTRAEMVAVERAFRHRANRRWLAAGVTLVDPATTWIDPDVTVGQDSIIHPNTHLQGTTTIGDDCVIGPNAILRNAVLGAGCQVSQAVVEDVVLLPGTEVPPFSHLRP
jgi:bifunctional UDP-N-acetylglucosamine pyrophosphorylase/glucosamine-1-phosphate N-acetyltransferase